MDWGATALTDRAAVNPDDMSAWTDCQKSWARYGGQFSYNVSGAPDSPNGNIWKFWETLSTNAADRIGPLLYPSDDWIVLKMRVVLNSYSAATNDIYWYAGTRYHDDWELLHFDDNVLLPTEVDDFGGMFNKRINTIWLTPFHTGRSGGGGVSTSLNYGWVIARSDGGSISFPQVWPE